MVSGDNYYTAEMLAQQAEISVRTAQRRLQYAEVFKRMSTSAGGRAVNYYDSRVLVLFPEIKVPASKTGNKELTEKSEVIMQAKKTNPTKGVQRVLSEKLHLELIRDTYSAYMSQGNRKGLRRVCEDIIAFNYPRIMQDLLASGKYYLKNGTERDLESMQLYWYNKVINRQDKYNVGVAVANNWIKRWEAKHNVNTTNGRLATVRYDMLGILDKAGLVGAGFGAGDLWVIDGTKFDAWVDINGTKKTFNYLAIMDGVTKMPLWLARLENGEKIRDVAEAIWGAVRVHGRPRLGIVADNGKAFRSREIQELVTSFYDEEAYSVFESCPLRRGMFATQRGPQKGAVIYPLAGMPRFPFKAQLERSFDELNKHQMIRFAQSYSGTRDSRYLTHEIGSVPKKALEGAIPVDDAFGDFLHWVYLDYVKRTQPGSEHLAYLKKKYKLSPTPLNAWRHYGGKFFFDLENGENQLSLIGDNRHEAEAESYYFYQYAIAEKKHRIRAGENYISVQHNRESDIFISEKLNASTWGREFVAVIDSNNPEQCHLFVDHLANKPNKDTEKVGVIMDKSGCLEYFDTAFSVKVRELGEVQAKRNLAGRARRNYEAELKAYDLEMLGEEFRLRNTGSESLNYLSYNENHIIAGEDLKNIQYLQSPGCTADSRESESPAKSSVGGNYLETPCVNSPPAFNDLDIEEFLEF